MSSSAYVSIRPKTNIDRSRKKADKLASFKSKVIFDLKANMSANTKERNFLGLLFLSDCDLVDNK